MANILIVDDEAPVRVLFEKILLREKFDVEATDNADSARELIQNNQYDVVLSDINMPGMSGMELLREIRKISPLTKVILITGMPTVDNATEALHEHAHDYLVKPVNPEQLRHSIHQAVRIKQLEHDNLQYQQQLEELVAERTRQVELSRIDVIWRLAKAGELRDEDTGNHVLRVGHYARELAAKINMDDEFINRIYYAAPLHDIGKIGVSDMILLKPGRLTPNERTIIEQHCAIGADILIKSPNQTRFHRDWESLKLMFPDGHIDNPILEMAAEIALHHHERWDGKGYPNKLDGGDIPLSARITSIADVYDALRSARPYKEGFSHEKSVEIITENHGDGHFDPNLIDAFIDIKDNFNEIFTKLQD